MKKTFCAPQNTEVNTLPADVCVFGHFGRLSPAAFHSADGRFDSGVKWWIHVSSIVTYLRKNSFLLLWKSCKQRFDRLWTNVAPTLNTSFSLTNVHVKWWIPCLLLSSTALLSHATSIYDQPKWVCGFF